MAQQLKKLAEAYAARGDRWRSWQLAKAWKLWQTLDTEMCGHVELVGEPVPKGSITHLFDSLRH